MITYALLLDQDLKRSIDHLSCSNHLKLVLTPAIQNNVKIYKKKREKEKGTFYVQLLINIYHFYFSFNKITVVNIVYFSCLFSIIDSL